ncbi:MAG: hypothetical protein WC683_18265 [bacterium]
MKHHIDGDALCITKDDFVDLQVSPAVFVDVSSELAQKILSGGFRGLTVSELSGLHSQLSADGGRAMTDGGFPYVRMEPKTRETVRLVRTCEPCRWWDADKVYRVAGWGKCGLAESDCSYAIYKRSLAVAQDYEGYRAHLETRHDFGCVQWEAKDEL